MFMLFKPEYIELKNFQFKKSYFARYWTEWLYK
jgi:hypothetical protein